MGKHQIHVIFIGLEAIREVFSKFGCSHRKKGSLFVLLFFFGLTFMFIKCSFFNLVISINNILGKLNLDQPTTMQEEEGPFHFIEKI